MCSQFTRERTYIESKIDGRAERWLYLETRSTSGAGEITPWSKTPKAEIGSDLPDVANVHGASSLLARTIAPRLENYD